MLQLTPRNIELAVALSNWRKPKIIKEYKSSKMLDKFSYASRLKNNTWRGRDYCYGVRHNLPLFEGIIFKCCCNANNVPRVCLMCGLFALFYLVLSSIESAQDWTVCVLHLQWRGTKWYIILDRMISANSLIGLHNVN